MILVVDDEQRIVELLRQMLVAEGFKVETAYNGVQAYELVKRPDCECMLLDIRMPKINGAELLMLMQSEGVHVPTIVMAAFQDFEEKELKQFENVVKLVSKPFDIDDMLAVVHEHAKKQ
jgi:DNA-binding NtrC family response regulator